MPHGTYIRKVHHGTKRVCIERGLIVGKYQIQPGGEHRFFVGKGVTEAGLAVLAKGPHRPKRRQVSPT
jgi:hypothetical protein